MAKMDRSGIVGRTKAIEAKKKTMLRKQQAFLRAYMIGGTVKSAVEATGYTRTVHDQWLFDCPDYRAAYLEAKEHVADMLEEEAIKRARQGTQKLVLYKGDPIKFKGKYLYETTHSDSLMMFLLKGLRPERYREQVDVNVTKEAIDAAINEELERVAGSGKAKDAGRTTTKTSRVGRKKGATAAVR